MQSLQEASFSVWMRSTDSGQLSNRLREKVERTSLGLTEEVDAEDFIEIRTDSDYLLLRLDDDKSRSQGWNAKHRNKWLL